MRVMFTTTGAAGHVGLLMPFADAVRRAGDVLVATRESSAGRARAAGYDV